MKTLRLTENSSPRIVLVLTDEDEDGNKTAMDLTAANPINFYIKPGPDSPDGAPVYSFPDGGITILEPRTAGRIAIQFSTSTTAAPGRRFYRLDVHVGSTIKPRRLGLSGSQQRLQSFAVVGDS